jgi:hypothetical protein
MPCSLFHCSCASRLPRVINHEHAHALQPPAQLLQLLRGRRPTSLSRGVASGRGRWGCRRGGGGWWAHVTNDICLRKQLPRLHLSTSETALSSCRSRLLSTAASTAPHVTPHSHTRNVPNIMQRCSHLRIARLSDAAACTIVSSLSEQRRRCVLAPAPLLRCRRRRLAWGAAREVELPAVRSRDMLIALLLCAPRLRGLLRSHLCHRLPTRRQRNEEIWLRRSSAHHLPAHGLRLRLRLPHVLLARCQQLLFKPDTSLGEECGGGGMVVLATAVFVIFVALGVDSL